MSSRSGPLNTAQSEDVPVLAKEDGRSEESCSRGDSGEEMAGGGGGEAG